MHLMEEQGFDSGGPNVEEVHERETETVLIDSTQLG